MKILVIGGSRFVGRYIVEAALARGHDLTLFNRGQTAAAPAGVAQIVGDRQGDLSALAAGTWDAVIDTCGYLPSEVARMAEALRGRVGTYLYISSVSVYASFGGANDEDSPLGHIDDADTTVIDGRTYGPLKAFSEAALAQHWPGARLVLRPGLVVGPHDPTQRFTWWPARLARAVDGEAVLAPGAATDPVQFIDARDLAAFAVQSLERGVTGTFNVVRPPRSLTRGDLLTACAQASGVSVRWVWRPVEALVAEGLRAWVDLPLALPQDDAWRGFMLAQSARAEAAGLTVRPLAQTVADTLAWYQGLAPAEQAFTLAGLSPAREAEALAAALSARS